MKSVVGKFKLYPRGFLGKTLEPILERKPRATGVVQYGVALFDANDAESIIANLQVEAAYQSLGRNDLIARKFEFKENALQEFMWAFGTMNFAEWYSAQFQSPAFSQRHLDFLDDTLNFLCGKPRRMNILNWNAILDEGEGRLNTTILSKDAEYYFTASTLGQLASKQCPIDEVVGQWMQQQGGFADMLTTGHILFGINE